MKTRVGVSVGAGVLVGAGIVLVAVGAGVSVGGIGVAVGAFRVRFAAIVCTAWVEIASKVGFGSTVGTDVGVAVGAALQLTRIAARIHPNIIFHTIGLECI
jgi:hypothetical protein